MGRSEKIINRRQTDTHRMSKNGTFVQPITIYFYNCRFFFLLQNR